MTSVPDPAALVDIFASAVLPVVSIVVAGIVLGRLKRVDPGPLNTVTIYVLAPALVFHSLVVTDLPLVTLARVGLGVLAFTLGMVAASELLGRALGQREPFLGSLVLIAAFPNAGNLGIPISDIAFGLVGNAAIPVMLLILGIQLARTNYGDALSRTGSCTGLRLVVAPAIGLAVGLALGFDNPTVGRVFVLETAMATAVTPLILVMEFAPGSERDGVTGPGYVSACVLVTTVVALPLLTVLIALLQSGILI